ncbi:MAG: hypothetical protein CR988_03810 [Treponema sp.]|nr:MAG: hypothetical protein CR988_03810 [Treponema sp.]
MKKLFYIFLSITAILIFAWLILSKLNKPETVKKSQLAKTIIPIAEPNTKTTPDTDSKDKVIPTGITEKPEIELASDESLITLHKTDIDADGADDQLIAVKKISEPHVYIIPAMQNLVFQEYKRNDILKTEITQPNTVSLYTLELGLDTMPAVVCSGMTSNNKQMLTIFLPTKDKNENLKFIQIADLRADIQIRIQANKNSQESGLNMYEIHSFDSDPKSSASLNQIEKIYSWNNENERYEKSRENLIPGEKIEDQILRKLGSGNTKLFKEFINGLWIQPESNSGKNRSLYFDNKNNEIIFFLDNIQETYEIETAKQRRYGLYMRTHNKSISNIILNIDIEIKSVDEIKVHVVENVARLKILTSSSWNGIYRKKDDSIKNQLSTPKKHQTTITEKLLNRPDTIWKNDEYELTVNNKKFIFKTPYGIQTGFLTTTYIKNQIILQMRYGTTEKKYILQQKYDNVKQKNTLLLSEIKLTLEKIEKLDTPPIILEDFPVKK